MRASYPDFRPRKIFIPMVDQSVGWQLTSNAAPYGCTTSRVVLGRASEPPKGCGAKRPRFDLHRGYLLFLWLTGTSCASSRPRTALAPLKQIRLTVRTAPYRVLSSYISCEPPLALTCACARPAEVTMMSIYPADHEYFLSTDPRT